MSIDLRHQHSERDVKRPRDAADVDQADVPLTTLHSAEVRPMDAGQLGEALLGDSAILAQPPHGRSERAWENRAPVERHGATLAA